MSSGTASSCGAVLGLLHELGRGSMQRTHTARRISDMRTFPFPLLVPEYPYSSMLSSMYSIGVTGPKA